MVFSDDQLKRSATYLAVAVSFVLIILKLFAWNITKSISIQASMMDSVLDAITSFINFLALRYSLRPADANHRWGHGKAEALAGFTQGIFIMLFSCFLLFSIGHRFFYPEPLNPSLIGIAVVVLSGFMTLLLVAWQRYVFRKTGSLIIQADSVHYETDLLSNFGIILGLYVSMKFNFIYVDFIVGLLITIYLVVSVWGILWSSVDILMDKELGEAIKQRIVELILAHPEVKGLHDMRTRSGGTKRFVQCSVKLDEAQSTADTERIIHEVRSNIRAVFPDMEVTVYPN